MLKYAKFVFSLINYLLGRLYESLRPLNTMLILIDLQHEWMKRNKTNKGVKIYAKKEADFEP